jgi:hypothetical protein
MTLAHQHIVRVSVADVWKTPRANDRQRLTQALLGDPILLEEEDGNWAKVRLADSYRGYIKRSHLVPVSNSCSGPWGTVIVPAVPIWPQRKSCNGPVTAYLGTQLRLADNNDGQHKSGYCTVDLPAIGKGLVEEDAIMVTKNSFTLPAKAKRAQGLAFTLLGTPYMWGGITCEGIDCSGLIQTAYRGVGLLCPRDVDQQYSHSRSRAGKPQPGDLVFFATGQEGVASHVGLYIGSGQFLHASNRLGGVVVTSLNSPFYRKCLLGWHHWGITGCSPRSAAGFDQPEDEINNTD